jgi:hypothetical protein
LGITFTSLPFSPQVSLKRTTTSIGRINVIVRRPWARAWREADYEATDFETVIPDLLTAPIRQPEPGRRLQHRRALVGRCPEDSANELRRGCDSDARASPYDF